MARFQILSLIGGGIRGAFVTSYLKELEEKLGQPIATKFDLIAGTSTGGIIAAGLALGLTAAEMHEFYAVHGASIFKPRPAYEAKGVYKLLFPVANKFFQKRFGKNLDAAFRAQFCTDTLEESIKLGFGDNTLGDVKCTRLIMPAVNLTKGSPHIFRSTHLPKAIHDKEIKVTDAVIATTAAPTYFPQKQIGENTYVDGGVWAADPSMLALAEAIRIQQFQNQLDPKASVKTDDIHLLSIGTGKAQYSLSPPENDAGMVFWASQIGNLMATAQSQGVHLPLKFFLGDRYRHVNFKMEKKWGLDEVEHIPELFALGKEKAAHTFEQVDREFFQHEPPCFVPFNSTQDEIHIDDFDF